MRYLRFADKFSFYFRLFFVGFPSFTDLLVARRTFFNFLEKFYAFFASNEKLEISLENLQRKTKMKYKRKLKSQSQKHFPLIPFHLLSRLNAFCFHNNNYKLSHSREMLSTRRSFHLMWEYFWEWATAERIISLPFSCCSLCARTNKCGECEESINYRIYFINRYSQFTFSAREKNTFRSFCRCIFCSFFGCFYSFGLFGIVLCATGAFCFSYKMKTSWSTYVENKVYCKLVQK